jgi:PPK2 family polyphosphate:nucleotide phosphotransferase
MTMKHPWPDPVDSPYLVPFDGSFEVAAAATRPPRSESKKKENKQQLQESIESLHELQRKLYADDRYSLLLVFQAMDAAGKDGTIRAVMTGVNPAGCQVVSFKAPSSEELDHDFLWRIARALPERGRIGIFNRSHYEEVLVVRVHPEILQGQKLPRQGDLDELWQQRFESIREFEQHLARNGTVIIKFWLNVSHQEQRERFVDRIDHPEKNWKFSHRDIEEAGHRDAYMHAYEEALNATSRPWAPWYAVPADSKPYMRRRVAEIIASTLEGLDMAYPAVSDEERARMVALRRTLVDDQEG